MRQSQLLMPKNVKGKTSFSKYSIMTSDRYQKVGSSLFSLKSHLDACLVAADCHEEGHRQPKKKKVPKC